MGKDLILKNEKFMTTKELANSLNVDVRTVQRVANAILSPATVQSGVINGGISKIFNEEQATLIKQEIQKHHNLASRQIDNVSTELEENQTMTVKEIAEELHVSDQTIRNVVKELFEPSKLLWRGVNGGNTLFLTYEQATAVKLKLRTRNNLKDNSVVSQIGNDLEFFALLKKREEEQKILDEYRDRRIEELKLRAKIAENALNRIANSKGLYSMNQTAKALKLPYGNITLYEKLRNMQILNKDNSPKQEQINNGNFKVVVKYINDNVGNKPVTLTTSKGLVYLAKRFNTEIDESVFADN